MGGAIRFGFGVTIGGFFRPWGWGYNRFDWGGHAVFINNARWGRTWVNRGAYVHPYESGRAPVCRGGPRPAEAHELHERSDPNARLRGKAAGRSRNTAITARANLLSGQRVLEDALKQATDTETAKKGKEGVWSADTYVCAPLHSDTNSYFVSWSAFCGGRRFPRTA